MAEFFKKIIENQKQCKSEALANKAYKFWNKPKLWDGQAPEFEDAIRARKLANKSLEYADNPRARYLRAVAMERVGTELLKISREAAASMEIDDLIYAVKNAAPKSKEIAEYHRALVDMYYYLKPVFRISVPQTLDEISFLPPLSKESFDLKMEELGISHGKDTRNEQLANLYCERGEERIAQGETEAALNDLKVALKFAYLGYNDKKKEYIASLCKFGGFLELAISIYEHLGIGRNTQFYRLELARAYAQAEKYDAALSEYQRLLAKEEGRLPGLKKECESAIRGLTLLIEKERLKEFMANGPKKDGARYL